VNVSFVVVMMFHGVSAGQYGSVKYSSHDGTHNSNWWSNQRARNLPFRFKRRWGGSHGGGGQEQEQSTCSYDSEAIPEV
jgi:hypothetical protein